MPEITQQLRPMQVVTGAGPDKLLLTGFRGAEGLSRLYNFQLELMAPARSPVSFEAVLGQPADVVLDLPDGQCRFFHGIVNRFSQGRRDHEFISYRAELVPWLWLLTKRIQSRIFQHKSVPDILEEVLTGLEPEFQLQGTFHSRDYCVQYRESDFAFASRLMEEEGIYYYFRHENDKAVLVIANTPQGHLDLPVEKKLIYEMVEGGNRTEARVHEWEKAQELRSGKVTLWDHSFELPGQHLDAEKRIQGTAKVGSVVHKLSVGPVDRLELYDYPGEYAQRFDGVGPGGEDRADDLKKIFEDNTRTAALRMQQEAADALSVRGASTCGQLTAGHKFALTRHPDADGEYVVTEVTHDARLGPSYRSGEGEELVYENRFTCLPVELPFRPARVTPKPTVQGTQTAVVVGPTGEEIFTDKYGRVKVQFHWDRQGKYDADSSCWVRVGTIWAGQGWGVVHIPRIGQEVIVDFLEGDPDQPIIIGSVYNAEQTVPFALPGKGMVSGFKSNSTPGGGGYNEITLNDTKGKEQITIHGQYDMNTTVEHDQTTTVHNNRTDTIHGTHTETIDKDTKITVTEGHYEHAVNTGKATIFVKAAVNETYDDTLVTVVTNDSNHFSKSGNVGIEATAGKLLGVANQDVDIQSKTTKVSVLASTEIFLTVGSSQLHMMKNGTIKLIGTNITIDASSNLSLHGAKVSINGDSEALMAVSSQAVKCDATTTSVTGTKIKACADGPHEITGAVVKIN